MILSDKGWQDDTRFAGPFPVFIGEFLQDGACLAFYTMPSKLGEADVKKFILTASLILALTPSVGIAAGDAASKAAEAGASKILTAMTADDRDAACHASLKQASILLEKNDDKTETGMSLRRKIDNAYLFFAGRVAARVPADKLAGVVAAGKTSLSSVPADSQVYFMFGCHAAFVEMFDKL
jgi:hypothetical protein